MRLQSGCWENPSLSAGTFSPPAPQLHVPFAELCPEPQWAVLPAPMAPDRQHQAGTYRHVPPVVTVNPSSDQPPTGMVRWDVYISLLGSTQLELPRVQCRASCPTWPLYLVTLCVPQPFSASGAEDRPYRALPPGAPAHCTGQVAGTIQPGANILVFSLTCTALSLHSPPGGLKRQENHKHPAT